MLAPGDHRTTWLNGVIQIHITRACDLSCTGCTQGSNLAGKPVMMSVDQFRAACLSLKNYYGVVGIFGGNPTLHPHFEQICYTMAEIIPKNQRGLWSNNLNGYGELCRGIFNPEYSNLNVHSDKHAFEEMKRDWPECNPKGLEHSRHSPPYVAMKDMIDLSEEDKWKLIEDCDINKYWSAMICSFRGRLRAYFCELAGAQSMLHQDEYDYPDTGMPVVEDWWKLPISFFDKQIKKHCMDCGIPLKGFGDRDNGTNEYVSKTHEKIYKLKQPKGKTIKLISSSDQLDGKLQRATDYIENGAIMSGNKVLIAIPTMEYARRADFYDYFNLLEKPEGTAITFSHGQSPARNRNLMIDQALQHNFTHIFFVDDDVVFAPTTLIELLKHDVDIVSGIYLMRNYPHQPIIFNYANEKGACRHHYPDESSGLIEIVACGLGCCLIKTDVFQKLEKPYIRLGELEKDHWCDDIGFFRRVREAGIKIHCDLNTQAGHMCSVTVWPERKDGKWFTTYDTNGSGRVSYPSPYPTQEEIKALLNG